jgi:hypothetical protein
MINTATRNDQGDPTTVEVTEANLRKNSFKVNPPTYRFSKLTDIHSSKIIIAFAPFVPDDREIYEIKLFDALQPLPFFNNPSSEGISQPCIKIVQTNDMEQNVYR